MQTMKNVCEFTRCEVPNLFGRKRIVTIEDLGLSTKTKNHLLAHNIILIGDLLQFCFNDLFKINGIGIVSIKEIESCLFVFGLSIRALPDK
jgi:DNA-directed RNA polymerase alpha subunit